MPTTVRFAEDRHGNAAVDLSQAQELAMAARDARGKAHLEDLIFGLLKEELGSERPEVVAEIVSEFPVWRWEAGTPVYSSPGEPACAFTLMDFGNGTEILALGFCYRYPGSEDLWWERVIRPRLRDYL